MHSHTLKTQAKANWQITFYCTLILSLQFCIFHYYGKPYRNILIKQWILELQIEEQQYDCNSIQVRMELKHTHQGILICLPRINNTKAWRFMRIAAEKHRQTLMICRVQCIRPRNLSVNCWWQWCIHCYVTAWLARLSWLRWIWSRPYSTSACSEMRQ